jgi:hypothetical protein
MLYCFTEAGRSAIVLDGADQPASLERLHEHGVEGELQRRGRCDRKAVAGLLRDREDLSTR